MLLIRKRCIPSEIILIDSLFLRNYMALLHILYVSLGTVLLLLCPN
jgi:hypothetical protein